MIDDVTLSEISKRLDRYRYGQYNLIGKDFSIEINPEIKQITIPGFYHNDYERDYGTCRELMECFCAQNSKDFPDLNFIKSVGKDIEYFATGHSKHCFIIAAPKNLEISRYTLGGTTLVDPSFGKCEEFYSSGYYLDFFMYERMTRPRGCDAVLSNQDAIPIYMTGSGELYMISAQFSERNPIIVLAKKNGERDIPYGLFSDKLSEKISSDKDLSEIIYAIKHSKKEIKRNNL